MIGLDDIQPWGNYKGHAAGFGGTLPRPITLNNLAAKIDAALGVNSRVLAFGPQVIDRVAVCSGGASSLITQVVDAGFNTYFSGENSHSHYHDAKDYGLNGSMPAIMPPKRSGLRRSLDILRTSLVCKPSGWIYRQACD